MKKQLSLVKIEAIQEEVYSYCEKSKPIFYMDKPFAKNNLMVVRGKLCEWRDYTDSIGVYIY